MTIEQFRAAQPQDYWPNALHALWLDGQGDWGGAHDRLQDDESRDGSWVHAYLHRKEGDLSNAGYWYRRAGRPTATGPLVREWEEIVSEFLSRGGAA